MESSTQTVTWNQDWTKDPRAHENHFWWKKVIIWGLEYFLLQITTGNILEFSSQSMRMSDPPCPYLCMRGVGVGDIRPRPLASFGSLKLFYTCFCLGLGTSSWPRLTRTHWFNSPAVYTVCSQLYELKLHKNMMIFHLMCLPHTFSISYIIFFETLSGFGFYPSMFFVFWLLASGGRMCVGILCCCLYHLSWRKSISLFSVCNMNINSLFFKPFWMWYLSPGDDVLLCFLGSWVKSLSQTKQACLPALSHSECVYACTCVCLCVCVCWAHGFISRWGLNVSTRTVMYGTCGDIWLVPNQETFMFRNTCNL